MTKTVMCIALTGLLIGCATAQSPRDEISRAELAVRKADESLASKYAPLDLVKAREKLDKAQTAARDNDAWPEAYRLALQARVDAELAEEKARAAQAEERANEMRRSIESLKAETERSERR